MKSRFALKGETALNTILGEGEAGTDALFPLRFPLARRLAPRPLPPRPGTGGAVRDRRAKLGFLVGQRIDRLQDEAGGAQDGAHDKERQPAGPEHEALRGTVVTVPLRLNGLNRFQMAEIHRLFCSPEIILELKLEPAFG